MARERGECTQSSGCVWLPEGEDSMGMGLVLGWELERGGLINRGEEKGKERKEESAMPMSASCYDA